MNKFALILLFGMSTLACTTSSHQPLATIEVEGNDEVQGLVLDVLEAYAATNNFQIAATDKMPREGRRVTQLALQREDGIIVASDNFLEQNVVSISIYSKNANVNWRSVKDEICQSLTNLLGTDSAQSETGRSDLRISGCEKK